MKEGANDMVTYVKPEWWQKEVQEPEVLNKENICEHNDNSFK